MNTTFSVACTNPKRCDSQNLMSHEGFLLPYTRHNKYDRQSVPIQELFRNLHSGGWKRCTWSPDTEIAH
jgi:hypothetical protein